MKELSRPLQDQTKRTSHGTQIDLHLCPNSCDIPGDKWNIGPTRSQSESFRSYVQGLRKGSRGSRGCDRKGEESLESRTLTRKLFTFAERKWSCFHWESLPHLGGVISWIRFIYGCLQIIVAIRILFLWGTVASASGSNPLLQRKLSWKAQL